MSGAVAEQLRSPGHAKLVALAEQVSFVVRHHPRALLPSLFGDDAIPGGRQLNNVDSIPGQGACQFKDGKCIADGKYFAKVGALADFDNSVLALEQCTSFDNFDGSCNEFITPPEICQTVSMGPVIGGRACVPVNSTADGMDFETGFSIRGDFGSLSAFITEDCTEGSVLDKTAPPACLPVWIALLKIVGCDTCIRELEVVRGPVGDSCAVHTTLEACISDNATMAARFVLCGDDPACASVSPNTIDNPLDIFYNTDYEYSAPAPSPADGGDSSDEEDGSTPADYDNDPPPRGSPAPDEGEDGVLEGQGEGASEEDYNMPSSDYDYGAPAPAPGDYDYDYSAPAPSSGDYSPDNSAVAPAPADYNIRGFDYGFDDQPTPAEDYASAYAPYVSFDYTAAPPDVRDVLEGFLASTAASDYGDDAYSADALPITVDAIIYYGDEPFVLKPGNPWDRAAQSSRPAPPQVQIPDDLKNITAGDVAV